MANASTASPPQASGYRIRLAHFNKRHHRVLYAAAFGLEFLRRTGPFDTKRSADQHAHFRKWFWDNEAIPTSEPPAARILQVHWQHRCPRFLGEKDEAWPEFVSRAPWTVGCDDHVVP